MADIHNLPKLKSKLAIKKDLEQLINVIDVNIRGLNNYKHYIPIRRLLNVMMEEREILNLHLEDAKLFIKEKGKVHEQS
jgi:hypothetical protein